MKTPFLIWMLAYPLVSAVTRVIYTKLRFMEGKEPYSDEVRGTSSLVEFIIWFGIGAALWTV